MEAISAITPGAAPAAGIREPREARGIPEPWEQPQSGPIRPGRDEYRPEEPGEPTGRYRPERDPDGTLRIRVDGPEAPGEGAAPAGAGEPDRSGEEAAPEKEAPGEGEGRCTCNTDRVDREIEALKKRQAQLERQLRGERDGERAEALQRELTRISGELAQKDNDAYRRQNASYTSL